ncbi:hypothetical protein A2U01_0080463, partial [Trifolium medium]|nr:hypothetical protein [Trifolium medium]
NPPPEITRAFGKFSHEPSIWVVRCFISPSSSEPGEGKKSSSLDMAKAVGTAVQFSSSSAAGVSMAIWTLLVSLSPSFTYLRV